MASGLYLFNPSPCFIETSSPLFSSWSYWRLPALRFSSQLGVIGSFREYLIIPLFLFPHRLLPLSTDGGAFFPPPPFWVPRHLWDSPFLWRNCRKPSGAGTFKQIEPTPPLFGLVLEGVPFSFCLGGIVALFFQKSPRRISPFCPPPPRNLYARRIY